MSIVSLVSGDTGKMIETVSGLASSNIEKCSALSQQQIQQLDKKKAEYIDSEHHPSEGKILGTVAVEVYKSYLSSLTSLYNPCSMVAEPFHQHHRIIYYNITKWVRDTEEKSIEKLINVYQTLSDDSYNIALIFDRDHESCRIYLALVNQQDKEDRTKLNQLGENLTSALKGNFPGVEFDIDSATGNTAKYGIPTCLNYKTTTLTSEGSLIKAPCAIATISCIPSEKSDGFKSQGIEKLLDGIIPEKDERYTIVLLATPSQDQETKKIRLFELYSAIAQFSGWQTNYSTSEGYGLGNVASFGSNFSVGVSSSTSFSTGVNIGIDANISKSISASANVGLQFSKAASENITLGKNEGISRTYVNYAVKHTLENIEMQVKRMEESTALGMWEFSGYVISNTAYLAQNAANTFVALTQGDKSYIGKAAVNVFWNHDSEGERQVDVLLKSIQCLSHPIFMIREDVIGDDKDWLMYPVLVDSTMDLSGKELARALNFPYKSISGFPVIECTPFGREVHTFDPGLEENALRIALGHIYHMRRTENRNVLLDVNSLASHTFITGSTGTGKSNVIYNLIRGLVSAGKKIMIIEPAKGEYKDVLGGDFVVLGTNPRISDLLMINPFSFPPEIHVLEHIDRLIEVLNACWPMYAAMPAVLKDAIERSYISKGWDLVESCCDSGLFPSFQDVLEQLPRVLDDSLYSGDTKSDYTGALITRIRSLTNGINGVVFCSRQAQSNQMLFDRNVIIDVSRIGSVETKAMLMGVLVMKLQEYRLSKGGINKDLQHITVIEEAHHLLKRVSTSQAQENSNLQGKSVEMLTNSIAEMRTYGEGFIIADQAPGLLDEAVIRNTNTKIALRLPDADDRLLVGKAMGLNDRQIEEIAKLPKGIGVVFQNEWIEAVLCHFPKFNTESVSKENRIIDKNRLIGFYRDIFLNGSRDIEKTDAAAIAAWIDKLPHKYLTKSILRKAARGISISESERQILAYNLFNGKNLVSMLKEDNQPEECIYKIRTELVNLLGAEDEELTHGIEELFLKCILHYPETQEKATRCLRYM